MTKISVLIPVYNTRECIVQCLESVINQSLYDIEIICINNSLNNNSLAILKEYEYIDERIQIINKEYCKNIINQALEIAKGEYIGIIESNCFIKSDMFENLYAAAKKHNFDIIKSNHVNNSKENSDLLELNSFIQGAIYKKEFFIKNKINFLKDYSNYISDSK